jgi:hypothetical protein
MGCTADPQNGATTMTLNEVFTELSKLSRIDKLKAMQFLANELAAEEEALLSPDHEFSIHTPLGNEPAAQVLWDVLQEDSAADDSRG